MVSLSVEKDTHILLRKIQATIYETRKDDIDIKDLIYLLVSNPDRAIELINKNKDEIMLK